MSEKRDMVVGKCLECRKPIRLRQVDGWQAKLIHFEIYGECEHVPLKVSTVKMVAKEAKCG